MQRLLIQTIETLKDEEEDIENNQSNQQQDMPVADTVSFTATYQQPAVAINMNPYGGQMVVMNTQTSPQAQTQVKTQKQTQKVYVNREEKEQLQMEKLWQMENEFPLGYEEKVMIIRKRKKRALEQQALDEGYTEENFEEYLSYYQHELTAEYISEEYANTSIYPLSDKEKEMIRRYREKQALYYSL